jgi:hypothetical protein
VRILGDVCEGGQSSRYEPELRACPTDIRQDSGVTVLSNPSSDQCCGSKNDVNVPSKSKKQKNLFKNMLLAVFRIHDILVWIRIRGSMPLTNESGSCHKKSKRSHKTVPYESRFFLLFLLDDLRIRIQIQNAQNTYGSDASGSATLLQTMNVHCIVIRIQL